MDNSLFYQPSGKVDPMGYVYYAIFALVVVPILSAIYAAGIFYIPIVYVNIFLTGALGFLVGFGTQKVLAFGKFRNNKLIIWLAIIAGILAIYFQWAVWLSIAVYMNELAISEMARLAFGLAADPLTLFSLIGELSQNGMWEIFSFTPTGFWLFLIWIAELLIVLFFSFTGVSDLLNKPFDEIANTWAKETSLKRLHVVDHPANLVSDLTQQNYQSLEGLAPPAEGETHYSDWTFYYCEGDDKYYLTINNQIGKVNKEGKVEYEEQEIVENIRVESSAARGLLDRFAVKA